MIRLICFHSNTQPYQNMAARCVETFGQFGMGVTAFEFESTGDWMKNALYRAPELLKIALASPADVVGMLDADVYAIKDPVRIREFESDFGVEDRGHSYPKNRRYSAGVVLFGPTELGRALLKNWAGLCGYDPLPEEPLREQRYLHDSVVLLQKRGLKVDNLGNSYNCKPERVNAETVIVHEVASRETLGSLGGKR